jgi:hypothetical protein
MLRGKIDGLLRGDIRIDHEAGDIEANDSDHEGRYQSGCAYESDPLVEVQLPEMQHVLGMAIYVFHGNLQPSPH